MRTQRPHFLTLVFVACLWRCASLEPDTGDFTSLTPDTVPTADTQNNNITLNSCTTQQNQTTNGNKTTTPTSTVPTPSQLGFSGSPANGFSFQSIEQPSLCLAAKGNTLVSQNTYTLAPCSTHPSQLFYWSSGTLAQTSSLCMTGQHTDHGVFNLAGCPSSVPAGQYALGTTGGTWAISQDNNVMYTNGNNSDPGTWTLGPTNSTLAAGSVLEMKGLNTTDPVAHFTATTKFAGATHIYLQNSNGTRCLAESSGLAILVPCAAASNQLWNWKNHSFVSNSGLCLSAIAATKDSGVNLQSCNSSNSLQLWFIGGGAIGLSTPYGSVQSGALALDVNAALSPNQPVINTMTLSLSLWSIGAQNYH